jgi:serine/threonine protein kinase
MIAFASPNCRKTVPLAEGDAGKPVICPACAQAVCLPADATTAWSRAAPLVDCALAENSVPGYEILNELGRGGMGVVYQARQVALNREVALKMILAGGHAAQDELQRFRTEAEALARLHHPNIVQVYEVGQHQGKPFFSLEFCSGESLERKLAGTPIEPVEAARLVQTLARAVQAAHEAKVIHRDLKPANVLLQKKTSTTDHGARG